MSQSVTETDARHPDRWGTTPIPARVAERAATRYTVDPTSGCKISTYSVTPQGYAQIGWKGDDGKMHGTTAHRAAWVHYAGQQIPVGMTVDHQQGIGCTSRRCVEREHLRLLENYENARRTHGCDWALGECANGHGPEHARLIGGRMKCGTCDDASKRRYAEANREKVRESQRRYNAKRTPEQVAASNAKQAAYKAEWQRRRRAAAKAARGAA